MELLRLRKRLVTARRGHKLLKDKQDELMRQFLESIDRNRELRKKVENLLSQAFAQLVLANANMSRTNIEEALMLPKLKVEMTSTPIHILNLRARDFKLKSEGEIISYGFVTTTADLDTSMIKLQDSLEAMIELAQVEKIVKMLAEEIEKTRRRVNALEYTLIPSIEEAIKSISFKLAERERSALTQIMKVKEMIGERSGL